MQCLITIPELHPSINRWKNWCHFKYNEEKKHWAKMIGWLCKGKEPFKGAVNIRIEYYFSTNRRRDYDNFTPKYILDGLVEAHLIEDDHTGIIQELDDRNFYIDKKNPRTEVIVTSL